MDGMEDHEIDRARAHLIRWSKPDNGCWVWQRSVRDTGYGQLTFRSKVWKAHRLSFFVFNGPLIDGLSVMHSCDNRRCINPAHLSQGTHATNMRQMGERKRYSSTTFQFKEACFNGHSLSDPINIYYSGPKMQRRCRICRNARAVMYSKIKRAGLCLDV
jgi:hypothetical protein